MGRFSSLEQIDTVQRFQPAPRQLSAGFFLGNANVGWPPHARQGYRRRHPSVFHQRAVVVRVETRVVSRLAFSLPSLLPLSLTPSHCP
ncbi:hypothetical protein D7S70_02875 [Ralstonia pickettii]|nr:hypothetical protein [Ralstonia pickettii]OYU23022.1 MAG: hypothetical protein CFE42_09375 [Ralstonia sp. PBBBR1]MBB0033662.1 hypothetical protein [Ralstonia pickettii]MBB0096334.1 hypothetical protein [Ralstonia pickettii]MBB0106130.1 hypothetical protein [Ralstonia pickettii]